MRPHERLGHRRPQLLGDLGIEPHAGQRIGQERIGQPGVVSETTTSTTPPSWISIDRTMSSSTMLR